MVKYLGKKDNRNVNPEFEVYIGHTSTNLKTKLYRHLNNSNLEPKIMAAKRRELKGFKLIV